MPQSWMRRCAGVQNVSRPTLSCQEMSQTPPTTLEATARTFDQMYQGMDRVLAETRSAVGDWSVAGRGRVPAIWVSSEEISGCEIWCCAYPRDSSSRGFSLHCEGGDGNG